MTETEWLTSCSPERMLTKVIRSGLPRRASEPGGSEDWASGRKLRLFACACCRLIWYMLTDAGRRIVEVAEKHADSLVEHVERRRARRDMSSVCGSLQYAPIYLLDSDAVSVVRAVVTCRRWPDSSVGQACLLRDVVGNPYSPAAPRVERNSAVLALAQAAYDERVYGYLDSERLAVLADARRRAVARVSCCSTYGARSSTSEGVGLWI